MQFKLEVGLCHKFWEKNRGSLHFWAGQEVVLKLKVKSTDGPLAR
jgi:hypothetical protein